MAASEMDVNIWQTFDEAELGSDVPSVQSSSFSKQESAEDALTNALPDIVPSNYLPITKNQWNTNEEVAAILMAFHNHECWLHRQITLRPTSGSMFLYNRKEIKFRQDGYVIQKTTVSIIFFF